MKKMIRFLALAFAISALNTRPAQEPFIVSNNGVLIGTAFAGAAGVLGGYFLMDHIQNPEQSETKKTSKLANSLAALVGGGASAFIVYKLLDNCTPASWANFLQKKTGKVESVVTKYGSGVLSPEELVGMAHEKNIERGPYTLPTTVDEMRETVGKVEGLKHQLAALGQAEPGFSELTTKWAKDTDQHADVLRKSMATISKDPLYLAQLQERNNEMIAAQNRAIEARKAAAQAAAAEAQRAQARALQDRNDIEAAKLRQQRRRNN